MKALRLLIIGLLMTLAIQSLGKAQSDTYFNKNKLDRYLEKLEQKNKFMGSVAIDSAGKQVYKQSTGYRQLSGDKIEANAKTKYRIGSVTKTFTATMILQLIEKEELSLSTKLAEYYPEIPQADSITVEHLLRHQSGLYNLTNSPDYPEWMTEERSKDQLLELFRGYESQFSPDSQTSYSNTNYVLLGYIIEEVTGKSYASQLEERITKPLNLTDTYYGDGIDPNNNEAASFNYSDLQWRKSSETDMSIPGGAGAIVSTPADLTDFIRALFEEKLISEESLDKMTTIEQGLGMGLMKIPFYDSYAYGHNGGIDGFQSNLSYFPKEKVAFAFTSNGLNHPMNDILIGMLSIYYGKDFEIPSFDRKTISLSVDQMKSYTGTYASDQIAMKIEIFVEDSTLKARATGQNAFPLTATNKNTMRFDPAGVVMKFDSLKSNKYQRFTLNQSGGSYIFKRKK